ncbi:MAG: hypothetical protein WCR52_15730 [Bacteroidota bacterium]|uniref:hypothetical protein n=1 Tax=Runella sp. TaxID=1960881 RepID=UPI00301969CA
MKKLSTLFLLLFIACAANGQVKIQRALDLSLENQIPEPEINRIVNALNLRLEEYGKAATLFNKNTRSINDESVAEFKNLFTPDAKICNDLYEYEEQLQGLNQYIGIAMDYFEREGIRFTLSDPVLKSIKEVDQHYICSVSLKKETEKYYKGNGEIIAEPKIHELEFVFDIQKNDWNSTKISAIRSYKLLSIIAPYVQYLDNTISFGVLQTSYSIAQEFKDFAKSGDLSIKSGFRIGDGFTWRSNFLAPLKSSKKNLFVTVGLQGTYTALETELKDYSIFPEKIDSLYSGSGDFYDYLYREAKAINVIEKIQNINLNLPIGLSYRVLNKPKTALFFEVSYIPSFSLYSKSTTTGTGRYDKVIYMNNNTFNGYQYSQVEEIDRLYSLGVNSNSVIEDGNKSFLGEKNIDYSFKPKVKISHQVGLSATIFNDFFKRNKTFGIAIGVDAIFELQPFVNNVVGLKRPEFEYISTSGKDLYVLDSSLLGPYIQDVKVRNIGLHIAFYQKRSRKP